jgi:hypothetical protein
LDIYLIALRDLNGVFYPEGDDGARPSNHEKVDIVIIPLGVDNLSEKRPDEKIDYPEEGPVRRHAPMRKLVNDIKFQAVKCF